jgi:hypothetical protein
LPSIPQPALNFVNNVDDLIQSLWDSPTKGKQNPEGLVKNKKMTGLPGGQPWGTLDHSGAAEGV